MATDPRELVTSYIQAVGERRLEALPSLVEPDAQFTLGDNTMRGRDAFVGAFRRLLPIIDHYRREHPFVEIVPISAADGTNVEVLEQLFLQYLPEGEPLYPADYVTDQPERFFIGEIVREQVLRLTHDELPFSTAVIVDRIEPAPDGITNIYCSILVDRESQKPIVIGRAGAMIKQIGTAARAELERYLESRVYLDLHVKVKSEWRDDERLLDELGVDRGRRT